MGNTERIKRLADAVDAGLWELGFFALVILCAKIVGKRASPKPERGTGSSGSTGDFPGDWGGSAAPD